MVLVDVAVPQRRTGGTRVFLWDHIVYRPPVRAVADPWVALSVIAAHTDRVRLGPTVTPLSRRRVQKEARETVALDRLSRGRLTLGVGLGSSNTRLWAKGVVLVRLRRFRSAAYEAVLIGPNPRASARWRSCSLSSHRCSGSEAVTVSTPTTGLRAAPLGHRQARWRRQHKYRASTKAGVCPLCVSDVLLAMSATDGLERGELSASASLAARCGAATGYVRMRDRT